MCSENSKPEQSCDSTKNFKNVKFIESHSCDSAFFSISDNKTKISHSIFTSFTGFNSEKLTILTTEDLKKLQVTIDEKLKNAKCIDLLDAKRAGFFGVTAKIIVDQRDFIKEIDRTIASFKK